MLTVYQYAKAQLLGMQFERFRMRAAGRSYVWSGGAGLRWLLAALVRWGVDGLAYEIFAATVKVL